jgi:hypothetical protein
MPRPLTFVVVAAGLLVAGAGTALGQIVIRAGADGGAYQMVNPMGQSLQNLWMPQMEKELDIVPEQKEAIAKLRTEVSEKMRSLWTNTAEGDPQERMIRYQEAAKKLSEDTERRIREILLPHQIRRLTQINLQMKLSQTGYGSASALAGDDIAKELGISDDQKAKLRETEQAVMKEIREKTQDFYKRMQEESREKLLGVLTASQRKKLEEMTGAKFEMQQAGFGGAVPLPPIGLGGALPVPVAPGGIQRIEIDRAKGNLDELKKALP